MTIAFEKECYPPATTPEEVTAYMPIYCACSSVKGLRTKNEDRCVAGLIALPDQTEAAFAFVCDGVGGCAGGDVASSIAIGQCLQSTTHHFWKNTWETPKSLSPVLSEVIKAANEAVTNHATNTPQLKEMATTIVGMLYYKGKMAVAGVGDSRVYLYREGLLEQLTKDDSLPQQLADRGLITAEEAENHPMNNVITHFLGLRENLESLTVHEYAVKPGDCIVLSSDGFHKFAANALPALCDSCVRHGVTHETLKQLVSDLTQESLLMGSDDNVSISLLYVGAGESHKNLRETWSYWKNGG